MHRSIATTPIAIRPPSPSRGAYISIALEPGRTSCWRIDQRAILSKAMSGSPGTPIKAAFTFQCEDDALHFLRQRKSTVGSTPRPRQSRLCGRWLNGAVRGGANGQPLCSTRWIYAYCTTHADLLLSNSRSSRCVYCRPVQLL